VDSLEGLARALSHLNGILDHTICLVVLGYILHRRNQSFSNLGLQWCARGAVLALPLFLAGAFVNAVTWPLVPWVGQTFARPGWTPPDLHRLMWPDTTLLIVPEQLLNGFAEELIARAWIMTMVARFTRRNWIPVVVSVSVQISYHFYQGGPVALSHIPLFTLYALFYARTRLVLPVALAHTLEDLWISWNYGLSNLLP
jgi:membrane protease YdiL (CAAX protease family)